LIQSNAIIRYYGANATRILSGLPHVSRKEIDMRGRPTKDPYTRPAINTLERLDAELGGKILENRQERDSLAEQMRHVEAVIKMLDPGYSLRAISVKRRKPNPWFKGSNAVGQAGPQRHSRQRSASALSAALQPRPQSDRAGLRKAQTSDASRRARRCRGYLTWRKVGELLNLFSEEEGANYLKNSGYVSV
jgi:hypothetical protein